MRGRLGCRPSGAAEVGPSGPADGVTGVGSKCDAEVTEVVDGLE